MGQWPPTEAASSSWSPLHSRRKVIAMAKKTRKFKVTKKPTGRAKKLKQKATRRAATKANSLFSPKLPFS